MKSVNYRLDSFNQYDIIFDGPQFTSWRIKYYQHTPLVKLPGSLQFYFVTKADNHLINRPEDLAAKKVCSIPPPNLNALILFDRLSNPAREPIVKGVKDGMKKVYRAFMNNQCVAAVICPGLLDITRNVKNRWFLNFLASSIEILSEYKRISSYHDNVTAR